MVITETDPSRAPRGRTEPAALRVTIVHHRRVELVGARHALEAGRELVLGREGDGALASAFDSARVSRRHASLLLEGERLGLRDLGSRNGTFVNGDAVERADLAAGDTLRIGDVLLLVERGARSFPDPPSRRLVGVSEALAKLKVEIGRAARAKVVAIVGEPGVGKELVAAEIHERSGRAGALVAVHAGAIGDGVLHAELFGHTKGAFSSATESREGLVAAAAGGTLFLDEISAASEALQTSLLRLLETGDYRPVGSTAARRSDAAFVAALQPHGESLVPPSFREDLWSRLSRFVVEVPPLRDRRADIPLLARRFAEGASEAGAAIDLEVDVAEALFRHAWPGNVRELRGFVERACGRLADPKTWAWSGEDEQDLSAREARCARGETPLASRPERAASSPAGRRRAPTARPPEAELRRAIEEAGSVAEAARRLGVPPKTIYRWLGR